MCGADTNAAAIAAIEFAIESAEVLNLSVDPLWQHTASRLHIPFDARHNIHPEFVGELLWWQIFTATARIIVAVARRHANDGLSGETGGHRYAVFPAGVQPQAQHQ